MKLKLKVILSLSLICLVLACTGFSTMSIGSVQASAITSARGMCVLEQSSTDEETLGKPIGSDIGKGKMTIIAIKGLASDESGRLLEILKTDDNSQDEIDEAIEILENCGAIEYAHNLALESVDKAKEVLEILPDSSSKQTLVDIADFVLERSA